MVKIVGLICLMLSASACRGQTEYKVACIAFYNFENLFDTIDSPDTDDFEFTPYGPNAYNSKVYTEKLGNLSKVIGEVGTAYTPDGPAILGVCEIENRSVLEDFVKQPAVASRRYQILHQDSKDGRGVDVGLLYQSKYFKPDTTFYYSLPTNDPGDSVKYSRDILFTIGYLDGELIGISVNHWPSRRGGETSTAHLRNAAAKWNHATIDSLSKHRGIKKTIILGDLNDDPINDSVRKYLNAGRSIDRLESHQMFNPFEEFYRRGLGTTAYQDAWSLFDQIILSYPMTKTKDGFRFHKASIHKEPYMTQKSGPYAGYPFRTYAGGKYVGGYSDHFPVYVLLVKPQS